MARWPKKHIPRRQNGNKTTGNAEPHKKVRTFPREQDLGWGHTQVRDQTLTTPAPKPCYPQLMTKHTYHPIPAKTPTLRQLYCQNQPLYAYCINSLTPFLHIFSSFSRPFPSFSRPFSSLSAKIHPTGNKNFLYCQLAEKVFLPAANRQQNDRQR